MPTKKIVLSNEATLMAILKNSFFLREGFELILVRDGQTGYQAVEAEAPTMAVFDLARLGNEQSLECCRAIKQDPLLKTTPVLLILPENPHQELADACWQAGCDAVVHRPLDAERFLDAACGLLRISRRLEKRFPIDMQLTFFDTRQKKYHGCCVNLTAGGMFLATESLFPVNSQLMIEFILPGLSRPVQVSARVAWVNHPEWRKKSSMPCGLGVQFNTPSQVVESALRTFLASMKIAV
ncbi:MAG: PilZ domain-containing protein [Desulfuromonadales bacterium]